MPEASMNFSSVTFTVAIRAAPQHTRTEGVAARYQFSVPVSGDALANPETTNTQAADACIAPTPTFQCGAPASRADNVALLEDTNDGKPDDAAACADGRVSSAINPALEEYIEGRVDVAIEHAVEPAVEEAIARAMESFCEDDLDGHIQTQLRWENVPDRDEFEQLEARVDELQESCNRVDCDDCDQLKSDMEALSLKVDSLRAFTEMLDALNATCDALVRRVTELELTVTSRAKRETTTTRARSRKRAV
ncbi:MAG: hypothetical protein O9319_14580 [Gemmatimonas sp.]|uniref:hypothetical protein n=2 Tax=Gemmatimonas sp. TaxID=1962908 RepID=UPI0022BD47A8|nr:hypothetical protein [Gemmatimonas sp.]MCZ8013831.1 hypothetical protein [Gemmatimonas sp.]MCZ8268079.1 hypothetical protein [Gemmatimonas sp.]